MKGKKRTNINFDHLQKLRKKSQIDGYMVMSSGSRKIIDYKVIPGEQSAVYAHRLVVADMRCIKIKLSKNRLRENFFKVCLLKGRKLKEYKDDVYKKITEREQESIDEKWEELVKLTTTPDNVVGTTSATGKSDRDMWWWC